VDDASILCLVVLAVVVGVKDEALTVLVDVHLQQAVNGVSDLLLIVLVLVGVFGYLRCHQLFNDLLVGDLFDETWLLHC